MNFRPIHAISILFTLQALFLAWFVTPLGDGPDESGHYAYVVDMTKGRPLPVLGRPADDRGAIPADLWKDFEEPVNRDRFNYIVQHPPIYYAVAAIPYAVAKKFTDDKAKLGRVPRLVSALSLGFLVLLIFKTLRATGASELTATAGATLLGFVPMANHLGSVITNDLFLTTVSAAATLYLVRFVLGQRTIDAYLCAFWLAIAGGTKMTAWLLIAAFVGMLIWELRRPIWHWLTHAILLTGISVSLPAWWMYRNYFFFGNPLYVYGSHLTPAAPDYTVLQYLQEQPFFEWLLYHFYALMGFSGYCLSARSLDVIQKFCNGAQMTRVEGISYQIFIAVSLVFVLMLAAGVFRALREVAQAGQPAKDALPRPQSVQGWAMRWLDVAPVRKYGLMACVIAAVCISLAGYLLSNKLHWTVSFVYHFVQATLLFAAIASVPLVVLHRKIDSRLIAYGIIIAVLFTLVLFKKGHEAYYLTGQVHGIQGRYIFPFVPLLMTSFVLATRWFKWQSATMVAAMALMAWAFLNAYVDIIMPFFRLVRL
ncbi:glycosyltransferase family 39 protein [Hydrogenophaga sp. 5NK40-0174]|uniref:glycosyltransferase family 39 protein n=1 Tax=Hydrogenophaga sp. 5NK40-0174 TaxID=3127649 RepID=UPI00310A7165